MNFRRCQAFFVFFSADVRYNKWEIGKTLHGLFIHTLF